MSGFENYSFVLEWDDLPEELREEKIDTMMKEQWIEAGGEEEAGTLAEYLENQDERLEVEQAIMAHFPVYF